MIVKTIHHLMGSPHKITPAKYCDCGRMKIGLDEIEIVQFKTINNGQYCLQIFLCNYYFMSSRCVTRVKGVPGQLQEEL